MASLQRIKVDGKYYWRIVESKRVNGKPRPVPIMYLGSADRLLERLSNATNGELQVKSYEHGTVAACKALADELELAEIIDQECATTGLGEAMVLIAINRLIQPASKNGWLAWARQTTLPQLFPKLDLKRCDSQYFCSQMQKLPLNKIPAIEDRIVKGVVNRFKIVLDTLFLDTTNCYTYISDTNQACTIAKFGKSKENRLNKRLFGVSLMVSREDGIPLYHHTIAGNQHDTKEFPIALRTLTRRMEKMKLKPQQVTIVFDRGFNSNRNFKLIAEKGVGFVAALRIGDVSRELFKTPLRRFNKFKSGEYEGLSHFRTTCKVDGTTYTTVLYTSQVLRQKLAADLERQLAERISELEEWQRQIADHVTMTHHYDDKIVQRKIERLLTGNFIKDILTIDYDRNRPENQQLKFAVNYQVKQQIITEHYSKRVLITNRSEWSTEQIINAYFSLAKVEHAFRDSKSHYHIRLRPQFHWTDHNIIVHSFTCYLALLIGKLLLKKASSVNQFTSIQELLEILSSIRQATVVTSSLSCKSVLEQMDHTTEKVLRALVPA